MAAWDAIAASFDTTRRTPWPIVLDFIKNRPPGGVLVDLGCGNGRHLLPATDCCTLGIGIDFSRKLLKITDTKIRTHQIDNLSLIQADLCSLPLSDDTVDTILFIAALHNIRGRHHRRQALTEVRRILRPNGRALISVWSRWQDKYRAHFLKDYIGHNAEFGDIEISWRQHKLNIQRFYHLYSRSEFQTDLTTAGLRVHSLQAERFFSHRTPDNYFAEVSKD